MNGYYAQKEAIKFLTGKLKKQKGKPRSAPKRGSTSSTTIDSDASIVETALSKKKLSMASTSTRKSVGSTVESSINTTGLSSSADDNFYKAILEPDLDYTMEKHLQTIVLLVKDLHQTKIVYTLIQYIIRNQLTSDPVEAKNQLRICIEQSAELCTCEDAYVIYRLILEKAEADGIIQHDDHIRFNNRAEVKRMEHAPFIQDMKEAIEANAQNIKGLEERIDIVSNNLDKLYTHVNKLKETLSVMGDNIEKVNDAVTKIKQQMKERHRVEAAFCLIGAVVNALTFGFGGSLLTGMQHLMNGVVDFGDPVHIREVIEARVVQSADGIENVPEAFVVYEDENNGPNDSTMIQRDFEKGAELAQGNREDFDHLVEVIHESNAVSAMGAIAFLAYDEYESIQDKKKNPSKLKEMGSKSGAIRMESVSTSTSLPPDFQDAFLSDEEEMKFPLHAAVKFFDMESAKDAIKSDERCIFHVDSGGRTALDLAALTGQSEMVDYLLSKKGKYKYKAKARMNAIVNKRKSKFAEYKAYVESSV